jgi:hypothetical protein
MLFLLLNYFLAPYAPDVLPAYAAAGDAGFLDVLTAGKAFIDRPDLLLFIPVSIAYAVPVPFDENY